MSRIDRLISEMCPKGVRFSHIGQVARFRRGAQLKDIDRSHGPYPVVTAGRLANGCHGETNYSSPAITISSHGAHAGFVNFWEEPIWLANNVFLVEPTDAEIEPRFFYFVLKSMETKLRKASQGGGVPYINSGDLATLRMPVPPLELQREIVQLLDRFTQLAGGLKEELEAEQEARRHQYEYYRHRLLGSDEDVEWIPLSEVCESISAGGDLPARLAKGQAKPSEEFPFPIFSNGTGDAALYGFTDSYRVDKEAVTIAARGTIGFHAVREPYFTPIVRLLTLVPDSTRMSARYLNYALDITEIGHSGGSIPQLTVPAVKKIRVPMRSLEKQEETVAILLEFDTRASELAFDLSAELGARRKQYEFYRDQLLTFEELTE